MLIQSGGLLKVFGMGLLVSMVSGVALAADAFQPESYWFELVDFRIDATASEVKQTVSCSKEEVHRGVVNLVSFDSNKNNSRRSLKSTYQPLDNDAAWVIDQSSCPSLKPYINGIGFHSFDARTGRAVIYLAAFNQKTVEMDRWQDTNPIGQLAMVFHPEFNVINITKFDAMCTLQSTLMSRIRLTDAEFVCRLDQNKGSVRLNAIKK